MKNLFKGYLKKVFSDLHSAIFGIIVTALILAAGGIWIFSKNLWNLLKTTMLLPTPLWVTTIFLALFVLVYIYLKNKTSIPLSTPDPEYREEFHVYWDKNNKMRCLNCGKPLKYSSSDSDPSIFYCSDPRCDSKHILKDKRGKKLSEQEAIDLMNTI
jgi:hypothetical protein